MGHGRKEAQEHTASRQRAKQELRNLYPEVKTTGRRGESWGGSFEEMALTANVKSKRLQDWRNGSVSG